ncbi:hypothetical protein Bbelb_110870 [Branchiostoma belcheri]|nr:hypothetical protein Bbelb_110870 [Branchiostoma belcheri]
MTAQVVTHAAASLPGPAGSPHRPTSLRCYKTLQRTVISQSESTVQNRTERDRHGFWTQQLFIVHGCQTPSLPAIRTGKRRSHRPNPLAVRKIASLMRQALYPSMEHIEVSTVGVEKMLKGLNPSKASGPDQIPPWLISKVEFFGIQGPTYTLNWLEAFLTNREQTVVVEGKTSAPVKVASGVPQGSVLGPLLFLLYINDLPDKLDSNVRLFADDCLLYVELSTQNDSQLLQKDLNTLEEWHSKWLMQFNPEKCYIMHITNMGIPHVTVSFVVRI